MERELNGCNWMPRFIWFSRVNNFNLLLKFIIIALDLILIDNCLFWSKIPITEFIHLLMKLLSCFGFNISAVMDCMDGFSNLSKWLVRGFYGDQFDVKSEVQIHQNHDTEK